LSWKMPLRPDNAPEPESVQIDLNCSFSGVNASAPPGSEQQKGGRRSIRAGPEFQKAEFQKERIWHLIGQLIDTFTPQEPD
jgi:hypothetical protein